MSIKSNKIIGIDLGTSNSAVAIMDGENPRVIENSEGSRTTASIVAYTSSGEILIGSSAKNQGVSNPEGTIAEAKRLIGKKYKDLTKEDKSRMSYKVVEKDNGDIQIQINGENKAPQQISAEVLRKMKKTAEEYLGEEVERAVITVPAYFNDAQRQATKDAASIAGLKVERIINEPTAAALAYGKDKKHESKIAVYDFGGGTFDVSILHIEDGVIEVMSTKGDTALGGADFDERLMQHVIDSFKSDTGIDVSSDKMVIQRVKDAVEKAKKELSTLQSADVNLPFLTADQSGPKHLNLKITRAKFNSLVEDLIEKSFDCCRDAIKDANLSTSDINEVLLVGGSTRVPLVQEKVKEFFGREPNKSVNPDEAVAVGAAIQGGVLMGDVKDVLLLDVTPLSLGIETVGGVFTKLIDRNTTLPTKKSQVFSTAQDNQSAVTISVAQGERPMFVDNKNLGQFNLDGIAPAPKGVPQIEVTFDIDANGILNVSAKDKGTGKHHSIKVQANGGLSDEEIERFQKEAELNKAEDEKKIKLIEAKNKSEGMILQVEKTIKENAEKIPAENKESLENLKKQLEEAIKSDDVSAIENGLKALTDEAMKLGEIIYKQHDESKKEDTKDESTKDEDSKRDEGSEKNTENPDADKK